MPSRGSCLHLALIGHPLDLMLLHGDLLKIFNSATKCCSMGHLAAIVVLGEPGMAHNFLEGGALPGICDEHELEDGTSG